MFRTIIAVAALGGVSLLAGCLNSRVYHSRQYVGDYDHGYYNAAPAYHYTPPVVVHRTVTPRPVIVNRPAPVIINRSPTPTRHSDFNRDRRDRRDFDRDGDRRFDRDGRRDSHRDGDRHDGRDGDRDHRRR